MCENNNGDNAATDTNKKICKLNDKLRQGQGVNGQLMLTSGINDQGQNFVTKVVMSVAEFDTFTPENDPHLEHDFGALEVQGQKIFFKVDYYDLSMKMLSPDPADPSVTKRVLTIMLAEEY